MVGVGDTLKQMDDGYLVCMCGGSAYYIKNKRKKGMLSVIFALFIMRSAVSACPAAG